MFFYEYLFVRASLVYLIYTALLGFLFYLEPGWMAYLRSSHVHAGLVGFFLNMVFGVAYWMMPRPGQLKQPGLEAATFYALNTGLVLRLVVEPFALAQRSETLQALLVLGALLQFAAVLLFAYAMQRRVVTNEMLWKLRKMREARQNHGDTPKD
ncbi:hypothetical protein [Oceanithermus profundus]|uniref:Cytochrome-c oxidase n=1 Tax=Oceanithermus profundus (strain DSM 14977 / NBRC 100410 / VKM B-2274 / 506) TaxID=670487 RepID=E4U6F8_OCEP5|nr:hypothetical protein [Oceanithermus profundus]ADR35644.1 hypothetical protein Ocepr_0181 [Oceanithermus profundus DSM 14977]